MLSTVPLTKGRQEMINDLRMASQKWDQEQRSGRRGTPSPKVVIVPDVASDLTLGNYEDSHTYRQATNGGYRASTSSPQLDGGYAPPVVQRMAPPDMPPYVDPRDRMYPPPHSGAPVTTAFVESSMYASHPPRQTPVGYGSQGDFFNPPPGYGHDMAPPHVRVSPQYPPQYASRDPRDEVRYAPEYQEPMRGYAYPPSSLAPNGGASSPPQPTRSDTSIVTASRTLTPSSSYPPPRMPQYDQFGRRKSLKISCINHS